MSQDLKLKASARPVGRQTAKDKLAAELYGFGQTNQHLTVEREQFSRIYQAVHYAGPFVLDTPAGDRRVVIRAIQFDPISDQPVHVDFCHLVAGRKLPVKVLVKPVGRSAAMTAMGGILVANLTQLTIECQPEHMVSELEVDLSKLARLKDVIRVEDLVLPIGVTVKNDPRAVIFSVVSSRKSKSTQAAETPAAVAAEPVAAEAAKSAKPAKAEAKKSAKK